MPANDVTVYADWGEVKGDDDVIIEVPKEEPKEEVEEPEDEVLGDSDEEPEIPEMSDTNNTKYGFILFFLGLLAVLFSKKEEEEVY